MRDRHYIPNKGCHGQQMHYLVFEGGQHVGIISGASSVWSVKARDVFFGLDKDNRRAGLPSIINNVVFRLETTRPNLGTEVLALWRRQIAQDWQERYGVKVHGFETFVVENEHRKGAMYRADNWTSLGSTAGRTKQHKSAGGLVDGSVWVDTEPKLLFARRVPKTVLSTEYKSTWRREKPLPADGSDLV
jgi:hypothetical protein